VPLAEFVKLKLSTASHTRGEMLRVGLEAFLLTWTPAMISTLLSLWFHHPADKASTVAIELLTKTGSLPAILILYAGWALLAPVAEEVAFRGILHRGLRRHWQMWPALIFGSMAFALIHMEFTPWWLMD
jgi:membrane protease YdiL (CAAX protease family)